MTVPPLPLHDEVMYLVREVQSKLRTLVAWAKDPAAKPPGIDHAGAAIFVTVMLGIALDVIAVWFWLDVMCRPGHTWVCGKIVETGSAWPILTGLAAAPSVLITWWWRHWQKQRGIEKDMVDIERAASVQRGERFGRAVGFLQHDTTMTRVAGVEMLRLLLRESATDHNLILATLVQYVNFKTRRSASPVKSAEDFLDESRGGARDVECALDVITHRPKGRFEFEDSLRFFDCDMVQISLSNGELSRSAWLSCAFTAVSLDHVKLHSAYLQFSGTLHLRSCNVDQCHLRVMSGVLTIAFSWPTRTLVDLAGSASISLGPFHGEPEPGMFVVSIGPGPNDAIDATHLLSKVDWARDEVFRRIAEIRSAGGKLTYEVEEDPVEWELGSDDE